MMHPTPPPYAPSSLYPPSAPPAYEEMQKPNTDEKIKEFLSSGYDFFILIDKSTSMTWEVEEGSGVSRWDVVKDCLRHIVDNAVKYDKDGVEVCFFGTHVAWHEGIESSDKVDQLFNQIKTPRGSTNLTEALLQTFDLHSQGKSINPNQKSIVLVITDGSPDDKDSVERAISKFTKEGLTKANLFKQQRGKKTVQKTLEFGIRFFQVGNDEGATEFLKFLDNDLRAKADIVATGNIEELRSDAGVRLAFLNAIWD